MWKSFGWCVALAVLLGCSGEPDQQPVLTKDGKEIDLELLDPAPR